MHVAHTNERVRRIQDAAKKLTYEATLFEVGATSLNKPELVYEYMKDVLEIHPMPARRPRRDPSSRLLVFLEALNAGRLYHAREIRSSQKAFRAGPAAAAARSRRLGAWRRCQP